MSTEPEIEAIRFVRLKLVCKKALEHLINKSLTMDQMQMCYPTIASTEEGLNTLEIARSQVVNFWLDKSLEEFESIFKEKDVENKLNQLDEIIQTAQYRRKQGIDKPVYVDSLTPAQLIDSTLLVGSSESLQSLEMIYKQLCQDNSQLLTALKELTEESTTLRDDISELLIALQKEVETLQSESSKMDFKTVFDNLTSLDDL